MPEPKTIHQHTIGCLDTTKKLLIKLRRFQGEYPGVRLEDLIKSASDIDLALEDCLQALETDQNRKDTPQ